MATKKTTPAVKAKSKAQCSEAALANKEFPGIDKSIVNALRLLHAAGILEESDNGWFYTASAYVTLPVGMEKSAMIHWPSVTTI